MSILFKILKAFCLFIFLVSLAVVFFPNATCVLPTLYVFGLADMFAGYFLYEVIKNG